MSSERHSLRARWVFPVDAPPIEFGTVEWEDGRITALHASRTSDAIDLGNAAVIPGLVNTHTHLEFSDLSRSLAPGMPFFDWVRAVVMYRREKKGTSVDTIVRGLQECYEAGTTTLGEITTADWSVDDLASAQSRLVVFRELLAVSEDQVDRQLAVARAHLERWDLRGQAHFSATRSSTKDAKARGKMSQTPARERSPSVETRSEKGDKLPAVSEGTQQKVQDTGANSLSRIASRVIAGISPHAPYTVHPRLFHALVHLARAFRAPLAIHLAETRAELEFLASGTGDCAEMLHHFGLWPKNVHSKPLDVLDYLRPLAELDRALVIHGNYLSPSAVTFLARHPQLTVVYCPRTHAYFGHSEHPWRQMLEHGVSVALGTDSRASNPDLSLWNELIFLAARYPQFDRRTLLELGTKRGAIALGLEDETGSLSIGGAADLAIVSLDTATQTDPYAALFSPHNRIIGSICSRDIDHPARLNLPRKPLL